MRLRIVENGSGTLLDAGQASRFDAEAFSAAGRLLRKTLGTIDLPLESTYEPSTGLPLVVARSVVGVGRFGTLDVEVLPKYLEGSPENQDLWSEALLPILLLGVTHVMDQRPVGASIGQPDFVDRLVEAFCRSVREGIAAGMPVAYDEIRETAAIPAGRIDRSRLAEWQARPWLVPFVRDEISNDSAHARYLWWATQRLRLVAVTRESSEQLNFLTQEFQTLGLDRSAEVPKSALPSLRNRLLDPAIAIADVLRASSGLSLSEGALAAGGLFWQAASVFEQAVAAIVAEVAPPLGLRTAKQSYSLARSKSGNRVRTQPDVSFIRGDGRTVALLDAKYKWFAGRPEPSDTYQMIAGSVASGCSRLALAYPHMSSGPDLGSWASDSTTMPFSLSALPIRLHLLGQPGGRSMIETGIRMWLDGELVPPPER